MKNTPTKNPEFVKRMVVDSENLALERKKFMSGKELTAEEMKKVLETKPYHPEINWGADRISMIPWTALEHLDFCVRDTVQRKVPGDFVETGAWRGGSCIVAKSIYDELGMPTKVYVCDSFEGLPKPDVEKYPDDKNDTHYLDDNMTASLDMVKANFKKFDLLDDRVIFVQGWFKDTMPNAPFESISVLRLDGDMYESTIDVLQNVYHKLSIGGYCVIDDYHHPACRAAVQDFRDFHGITDTIEKVDADPLNEVHYWVKVTPTKFVEKGDYPKRGIARTVTKLKEKSRRVVGSFKKQG